MWFPNPHLYHQEILHKLLWISHIPSEKKIKIHMGSDIKPPLKKKEDKFNVKSLCITLIYIFIFNIIIAYAPSRFSECFRSYFSEQSMSLKFIFLISKVTSYWTEYEESKEMFHMGQSHLRKAFGGKWIIFEKTLETDEYTDLRKRWTIVLTRYVENCRKSDLVGK